MRLSQLKHLRHINRVLVRYRIDELIAESPAGAKARWMRRLSPTTKRIEGLERGERIRLALQELGPVFVKLGQALSTRPDMLPADIANELAKLQDKVPPFPGAIANSILKRAYGKPANEVFLSFDIEPLAAASVAQVHAAILPTGQDVVVKLLRPGIQSTIERDLELMYALASLADKYWADGRRLRPLEVVAEFERTILDELDLLREAANGSTLRNNFHESPLIFHPEIHWDFCNETALVMERVHGIPIANISAMREANVNMKVLAERGVEIFFTQVFRDNFFHADMHPGNIFVDISNPELPKYLAIDFGIVGSLTLEDQNYLANMFLAFFNRDYRKVAELHLDSGWVPETTRVEEFESAARSVCEPFFDRPLGEISFGQVLLRLFQLGRRFDMHIQPQLVLLQKTLLNIEGMGRQLYPQLNLWDTAKPYLEQWAKERMDPRKVWEKAAYMLPELPDRALRILNHLERDLPALQRQQREELALLRAQVERSAKKQTRATVGGSLVLAALIMQFGLGLSAMSGYIGTILGSVGVFLLVMSL
jgi:ubiquinone biosynthesis protein